MGNFKHYSFFKKRRLKIRALFLLLSMIAGFATWDYFGIVGRKYRCKQHQGWAVVTMQKEQQDYFKGGDPADLIWEGQVLINFNLTAFPLFLIKRKGGGIMKLTIKQQKFCDIYVEIGNATQAAIQAGYSSNAARQIGADNLSKAYIKTYIKEQLTEISNKRIADAVEVMEYLTKGMRMELTEDVVVVEGCGDGCSEARLMNKPISVKESNRCAELLGKRYRLFVDKIESDVNQTIIFEGEDGIED